jgi:hypothetical protein
MEEQVVVIHGSALRTQRPCDVDVVWRGGDVEDMITAVREWAAARGLSAALPIDAREEHRTNKFMLPTPTGVPGVAEIIRGDPGAKIGWMRYGGLAGLLRAHGDDTKNLRKALRRPVGLCIALAPGAGDRGADWGDYVDGLTALRSAARHVQDWDAAMDGWEWGPLLTRLRDEDPRPGPTILAALKAGSPTTGGTVLSLGPNVGGCHHGGPKWDPAALAALLWPAQ